MEFIFVELYFVSLLVKLKGLSPSYTFNDMHWEQIASVK